MSFYKRKKIIYGETYFKNVSMELYSNFKIWYLHLIEIKKNENLDFTGTHFYECAIKNLKMKLENRCCGNKLKNKVNSYILRHFYMGTIEASLKNILHLLIKIDVAWGFLIRLLINFSIQPKFHSNNILCSITELFVIYD